MRKKRECHYDLTVEYTKLREMFRYNMQIYKKRQMK